MRSGGIFSTVFPLAALLLGPWSPPVLLLLFLQGQSLVCLVAGEGDFEGDWGKREKQEEGVSFSPSQPTDQHRGAAAAAAAATESEGQTLFRTHHAPSTLLLPPSLAGALLKGVGYNSPPILTVATLVGLFSSHAWGATGHAAQFSALAFNSGFLGWAEFEPLRSGILLAGNTFVVSHCVLSGPLLLLPIMQALKQKIKQQRCLSPGLSLAHLLWAYHILTLLGIATLCTIERRHLMVWGVFAPKLTFEACGLCFHAIAILAFMAHAV